MKNYEKPILLLNEELAEGVYAASGDCWTISTEYVNYDNSHMIFKVICNHSTALQHISAATTVTLTFSDVLTDARPENAAFTCSFAGNTMVITRTLLADAYKSGDNMTYQVWVKAADEATTKALTITGAAITCDKQVNVQGNGGNEI